MDRLIVVAFRMPPAVATAGPEGDYLNRARSLCARGEALGGRLVAWGASAMAMAWDIDSIENAILLATSVREESLSPERAWACGVAEGELDRLAPDGQGMHLAWGTALVAATSLARIAKAGKVLVDGDVRALQAGKLAVLGPRLSTVAGRPVRGWRLDLSHPWRRGEPVAEELSSSDLEEEISSSTRPRGTALAERVRALSEGESGSGPAEALAELRRARALAEGGPPAGRCQAALALAMTLSIAGRPEEALLEALDALARAREVEEPRAIGACLALLAKLYAAAGLAGAAARLREVATGG